MNRCGTTNGYLDHRKAKQGACPDCLRAWREYYSGRPRRVSTFEHTCPDCGEVWRSTTRKNVRCRDCALERRRGSTKSRALVPAEPIVPSFCPLPDRHPARLLQKSRRRRPRIWYAGRCGHCGESFVDLQPKARYCSISCGRAEGKRRRGYFKVAPKVRLAIYERDNWTCQLCLEPVDPSLPASNLWAASLDHIECQAWALIPDHSPENLRLAHRWCNSVRGDETYYTADMLVA